MLNQNRIIIKDFFRCLKRLLAMPQAFFGGGYPDCQKLTKQEPTLLAVCKFHTPLIWKRNRLKVGLLHGKLAITSFFHATNLVYRISSLKTWLSCVYTSTERQTRRHNFQTKSMSNLPQKWPEKTRIRPYLEAFRAPNIFENLLPITWRSSCRFFDQFDWSRGSFLGYIWAERGPNGAWECNAPQKSPKTR